MRILVFDDNQTHLRAAGVQLSDHDLTLVGGYLDAQRELKRGQFEVFLTDLLVPAQSLIPSRECVELLGQEMPLGMFAVLFGAMNGVKYVGLLTDSNHHDHPASYCIDAFNGDDNGKPTPFFVGECKVILTNAPWLVGWYRTEDLSRALEWEELNEIVPTDSMSTNEANRARIASGKLVLAKRWDRLLNYLL